MPARSAVTCLVVLALGLGACGDDDEVTTEPSGSNGPLVSYERTGGIAGLSESLTVAEDGQAELGVGQPDPATTEFGVADAELESLRATVEAADLGGVSLPGGPSACADCFVYEIETEAGAVTYDDAQADGLVEGAAVPDSVTRLAGELQELVDSHR